MSGASERANGQASGSVLQSVFLAILDHSDWVMGMIILFTLVKGQSFSLVHQQVMKMRGNQIGDQEGGGRVSKKSYMAGHEYRRFIVKYRIVPNPCGNRNAP